MFSKSQDFIVDSGTDPTLVALSSPPLKIITVGTPLTPNLVGELGPESISYS